MTDVETIFVVLAVVYLYEGLALLTGGGRTYASQWGKWFRPRPAEGLWGNESRSVHVAPLLPTGAMLVAEHWPISVGPDGVLGFSASAPGARFRPTATERFVPFDAKPDFDSDGPRLLADGELLARTNRPELAAWLAGVLTQAASLPPDARAAALEQRIAGAFQKESCRQRWDQVRTDAYWARFTGALGFYWVFAGGAACYYVVGDRPFALQALLGFWSVALVGWVWAMVEFYIAHKKLYPARPAERFKMTVEMILPPTAMRSFHRLAFPSLAGWHPLAVAATLCKPDDLRRVAREFLRDLDHPLGPFGEHWDASARRTETWHRARVRQHALVLLAELEIDPASLLSPPAKEDPAAVSFCPRCEREFSPAASTCTDCGNIPLQPFDLTIPDKPVPPGEPGASATGVPRQPSTCSRYSSFAAPVAHAPGSPETFR